MDQPWWGTVVQWTVWGIVMTLVMGWVARSRLKTRPHPDSRRLVHPPSTLIIGVVVFLFFAGIAIISNVFPNKTVTWGSRCCPYQWSLTIVLVITTCRRRD